MLHAVIPEPMINTSTSSGGVSDACDASNDGGCCQTLGVGFATGFPGEPLTRSRMAIYRELRLRRVLKAIPREETIAPMAKKLYKKRGS
jgi:hypothetical protein